MVFYKKIFGPKADGEDTVRTKSILRRNRKDRNTVRNVSWSESFDTRDADYTFEDERDDYEGDDYERDDDTRYDEESIATRDTLENRLIDDFNWVYNGESMYTYEESMANTITYEESMRNTSGSASEDATTFATQVSMSSAGDDVAIEVTPSMQVEQQLQEQQWRQYHQWKQQQPAINYHNLACASSVSDGTLIGDRYKLDDADSKDDEEELAVMQDDNVFHQEKQRQNDILLANASTVSEATLVKDKYGSNEADPLEDAGSKPIVQDTNPKGAVPDAAVPVAKVEEAPVIPQAKKVQRAQEVQNVHEVHPSPVEHVNEAQKVKKFKEVEVVPSAKSAESAQDAKDANVQEDQDEVFESASVFVPGEALPVNLEFRDQIMHAPSDGDSITVGSVDTMTLYETSFDNNNNQSWVDRRVNSDDSIVSLKKRDAVYQEAFEDQSKADASHGHIGLILPFMKRFNFGAFLEETTMFSWDAEALKIKKKTSVAVSSSDEEDGEVDGAGSAENEVQNKDHGSSDGELEKQEDETNENGMEVEKEDKQDDAKGDVQSRSEEGPKEEVKEEADCATDMTSGIAPNVVGGVEDQEPTAKNYPESGILHDGIVDTDTFDDECSNQVGQVIDVEQCEKATESNLYYANALTNNSPRYVDDGITLSNHSDLNEELTPGKNNKKNKQRKRRGPIAFLKMKVLRSKPFRKGSEKNNRDDTARSSRPRLAQESLHEKIYQDNIPAVESCYTTESILNELSIIENTAKLIYQERIMGGTGAKHNDLSSLFNPDDDEEEAEPVEAPKSKKRARPFAWLSKIFFSKINCDNDDFGCDGVNAP